MRAQAKLLSAEAEKEEQDFNEYQQQRVSATIPIKTTDSTHTTSTITAAITSDAANAVDVIDATTATTTTTTQSSLRTPGLTTTGKTQLLLDRREEKSRRQEGRAS